jgi:hypothetical protein
MYRILKDHFEYSESEIESLKSELNKVKMHVGKKKSKSKGKGKNKNKR